MRAAIYARMSTDKQSPDSPADQVARCREFAAARGFDVVEDLIGSRRAFPARRATTGGGCST
jgi:DNA invertase Pin-like site-specific DNA recombinase